MSEQERRSAQGADYENVGADYLEQRQLQKGAAGWVLLAGLGVAYVISGDFAGWHFGLGAGGWGRCGVDDPPRPRHSVLHRFATAPSRAEGHDHRYVLD
jgi:hypothetical protein